MYAFHPETWKYKLYSDEVLKNPGLVPKKVFWHLIVGNVSSFHDYDGWEEDSEEVGLPGWWFGSGAIGLKNGAPPEAVESWQGYLRHRMRRSGMTEEEILKFEKKQQNAQNSSIGIKKVTIPEVLSTSRFDDRILNVLTTDKMASFSRGEMLAAVTDDEFGSDFSKKRTDYADVIVASVSRLQDRGLLSKFEDA